MDRGRTVDRTGGPWTAGPVRFRSMDRDRTGPRILDRGPTGPTVGQHYIIGHSLNIRNTKLKLAS